MSLCASAAILTLINWPRLFVRYVRDDRVGRCGLRVVPAGRLPQGRGIFDGAGAGWRPGPVLGGASRIPLKCGPGLHRVVGRQRGLPLFENPGRERLLLAGHIDGARASRPFATDGASGRNGLEKDPSGQGPTTVADGLKPACGKMNHAAVMIGKTAVFVLYSLPWLYPFPTCRMTSMRSRRWSSRWPVSRPKTRAGLQQRGPRSSGCRRSRKAPTSGSPISRRS